MARNPFSLPAALALALAGLALPAAAQAPGAGPAAAADTGLVYRREVFEYQAAGRPDPFRPLLTAADMGVRLEDMRLTAVVYNPNPRLSVAVFSRGDATGSLRVRVGQRVGNLTVMAIYPRRVDVRVEEFGQARVQSMGIKREAFDVAGAAPPAAPASAPAPADAPQTVVVPLRQEPQQPAGPLQRGGRRPAAAQPAPAQPSQASSQPRRPNYP